MKRTDRKVNKATRKKIAEALRGKPKTTKTCKNARKIRVYINE